MRHGDRLDLAISLIREGLSNDAIAMLFEGLFEDFNRTTTHQALDIIRRQMQM